MLKCKTKKEDLEMNNIIQDAIAGFVLVLIVFLFCALVLPIAIDRELARIDVVNEIHAKQYGEFYNAE